MRIIQPMLGTLLCCAFLQLRGAEPAPLAEVLKTAQAVAYVHVTHASEELHDNLIQRTATLTLCGRATGVGEQTQLEIIWTAPAKADEARPIDKTPLFSVGDRCIVLLTNRSGHWETVGRLNVSPEGKFQDENVGTDIGLKAGIDANAAVQLIEARLKKEERHTAQRIAPPPPSARSQPWKLMRVSPLRQIWPFFPR